MRAHEWVVRCNRLFARTVVSSTVRIRPVFSSLIMQTALNYLGLQSSRPIQLLKPEFFYRLIDNLGKFEFEAKKDTSAIFNFAMKALVKKGAPTEMLDANPNILLRLVELYVSFLSVVSNLMKVTRIASSTIVFTTCIFFEQSFLRT